MSDDILDLIDGALHDVALSDDAMRWAPPEPPSNTSTAPQILLSNARVEMAGVDVTRHISGARVSLAFVDECRPAADDGGLFTAGRRGRHRLTFTMRPNTSAYTEAMRRLGAHVAAIVPQVSALAAPTRDILSAMTDIRDLLAHQPPYAAEIRVSADMYAILKRHSIPAATRAAGLPFESLPGGLVAGLFSARIIVRREWTYRSLVVLDQNGRVMAASRNVPESVNDMSASLRDRLIDRVMRPRDPGYYRDRRAPARVSAMHMAYHRRNR